VKPASAAAIAAGVYVLWLFFMMGGGGTWAILVVIILAFIWAGLWALLLPVFLLAAAARRRRRAAQPWRGHAAGSAAASLAALAVMAGAFHFVLPGYFRPPYEEFHARHDPARDFTTSWGARMIAIDIAAEPALGWPARTLWVAETELTRGQYARLMGAAASGDAQLPYTSASRADVGSILLAMNGASRPAGVAEGKFRLPEFMEATAYSGNRWINRHPKSWYSCESALQPAASFAPNGVGLRGTVENAGELVVMDRQGLPMSHCAMQGGVGAVCGRDGGKSVFLVGCDDRSEEKVWSSPLIGLRVVYAPRP